MQNKNAKPIVCGRCRCNSSQRSSKCQCKTGKTDWSWGKLMRQFRESQQYKEECKTLAQLQATPSLRYKMKRFSTGSTYEGTWNIFGKSGHGTYTFPNGVIYTGEFEDGLFHGEGEMRYPEGAIMKGKWKKGHMIEKTLFFADGLEYDEVDWLYCKIPDRRFSIEYNKGLQPGGKSYLTADQPTKEIPDNFYDTGDGFYDPKGRTIYKADQLNEIVRSTGPEEAKWIVDNCRTSPDNPMGPRPDLYEEWTDAQTEPKPPPPPPSRGFFERDPDLSVELDFGDDDAFYESLRQSSTARFSLRTSSTASGVKFSKKGSRFRWDDH